MSEFTVVKQPLERAMAAFMVICCIPPILYMALLVAGGYAGVFHLMILLLFSTVLASALVYGRWIQPHKIRLADRGVVLSLRKGELVYPWAEVEWFYVRKCQENGFTRFWTRLAGHRSGPAFIEVRLRKSVRAAPLGRQTSVPLPFMRSFGYYVQESPPWPAPRPNPA